MQHTQVIDSKANAPVITTPLAVIDDTRLPIPPQPNLWGRIAIAVRAKGYSLATERAYVHWAKRLTAWHGRTHPLKLGAADVQAFLNHLAVDRECAPNTCKQALCAIIFVYREVLGVTLPWLDGLAHPRGQPRLPTVLSQLEVRSVLERTTGLPGLVLRLQYGTGLRMMEALRLRVKDLDLDRRVLTVREGKGGKDRTTMVPEKLVPELRSQLDAPRKYTKPASGSLRRCGAAKIARAWPGHLLNTRRRCQNCACGLPLSVSILERSATCLKCARQTA